MLLNESSITTKSNNLNLIRLLAAISVTFGHSYIMFSGSPHVFLNFVQSGAFGFYAVAIFFCMSGFLITQSYFRNPNWKVFLKSRILRLAPGFFFANFITALIIVYIIKNDFITNYYKEFIIYIIGGALFFFSHSFPDAFSNLHFNSPNGSMWTLSYEFRMYVLVLIFGLIGLFKNRNVFLVFYLFLLVITINQVDVLYIPIFNFLFKVKSYDSTYASLPICFGLGILFYLFKDKIYISVPASICILIISFFMNSWLFISASWIYFTLSFGYYPKYYISKLNFKNDLSYGVYILSWPIQQMVLHLNWAN